jgi:1-acyl-sn-glycerol-3-phosphate acyltransferase
MKKGTGVVEKTTSALVRLLLRPKPYFLNEEKQADKLHEPSILVINHTSHLDGPVVNTVFRKDRIHNLAAKDRFEQPGFGFFLRHTRCIPIDRQNPDLSWIHESLRVLHEEKENVAIFPEGAHGTHRKQLPFHSGVVMLAALANVPIVMVYIDGPHKILRKRSKLIIAPPYRLPSPTEGINSEYIKDMTEILQNRMTDLMNEFIKKNEGVL